MNDKIEFFTSEILALITEKLQEDEDFTEQMQENPEEFIFAISTSAPAILFHQLTGESKNFLEFNHLANQLCFEFMSKEK